jgi:hypothetical protein
VLASVLLRGKATIPDVKDWEAWLSRTIPKQVADIKVEVVFVSNSSLCLITVPIATWSMFQEEKAFNFVAYVESNNILKESGDSSYTGLEEYSGNVSLPR